MIWKCRLLCKQSVSKICQAIILCNIARTNFDNYYLTIERIILVFSNGILILIIIGCSQSIFLLFLRSNLLHRDIVITLFFSIEILELFFVLFINFKSYNQSILSHNFMPVCIWTNFPSCVQNLICMSSKLGKWCS